MTRLFLTAAVSAGLALALGSHGAKPATLNSGVSAPEHDAPNLSPWKLTWSDEFNGPNGSPPDPAKWTYDLGGKSWGNSELETYTNRTQNSYQQDGMLVIQGLNETFTGADGITRNYTSARLKTHALFSQKFGRFEARIRIAYGQGLWPAFWMLGDDIASVGWPACGEIDVMENIGKQPSMAHGSMHGPGYSGDHGLTRSYSLPGSPGKKFSDDFISLRSSGITMLFASMWTPTCTRRALPAISRKARAGSTIIHFSFS